MKLNLPIFSFTICAVSEGIILTPRPKDTLLYCLLNL